MKIFELIRESQLSEIAMSPGKLSSAIGNINASVGIEYEMTVPITDIEIPDDIDADPEPDFSDPQPFTGINDIYTLFDVNGANTRGDLKRLELRLKHEYNQVKSNPEASDLTFLEFLEIKGFETDVDIYTEYSDIINWPYWVEPTHYSTDVKEIQIAEIARRLEGVVGAKVEWSASYHGAKDAAPGNYRLEIDRSVNFVPGESLNLEFITPPLPVDKTIQTMKRLVHWADSVGIETDKSTGLHVNVSVSDHAWESLDYVKLVLLLGDKHILDKFQRSTNAFCQSSFDEIRSNIRRDPDKVKSIIEKMQSYLLGSASKIIHSGETAKHVSVHPKDGYIEFRSPGNDWLDKSIEYLENTVYRFVVVLNAALDPDAHREEYVKKLYKLLSDSTGQTDMANFYIKFNNDDLTQEKRKKLLTIAQTARKTGQSVDNPDLDQDNTKINSSPPTLRKPNNPFGNMVATLTGKTEK